MITILTDNCNPISQILYDNVLNNLQNHQLGCICGHSGCMSIHGYYNRDIKYEDASVTLRIRRVICSFCKTTHAILLASIVPYSQISLHDQVRIINCHKRSDDFTPIMEDTPSIDESNIRYVIKQYLCHWLNRLLAASLPLCPSNNLVKRSFSNFNRQFMQIKRTPNLLFLKPT
ncbi:DUF6431 domain-containing protein [Fusibacter sp. 3D3]|uniref:DUF6431 domain-containing protein n=1 Tax=Fusibacter sp. 3D3 TaxID=1048380 RepID=UPI000856AE18|nr:DUF6431 domain-containing protein [Fusibacter sp. 3D3]GAU75415.1 hypothetical protein F3D3_0001 [Fusibacter sp. 3D3]GAU78381.1 hypothetical protein F3D3_3014 [Fusibacter sp. 3D3]GAU79737.1 hypothetical protein F3D3_4401 [Fusibacter sp. 3D3]GAU79778.1 hypothetical protein F3D3_4443 [Fusibacter sp. 3D3]